MKQQNLDDKGRCCGRKPIRYAKGMLGFPYLFCARCDRSFNLEGQQIPNSFWGKFGDKFCRVSL